MYESFIIIWKLLQVYPQNHAGFPTRKLFLYLYFLCLLESHKTPVPVQMPVLHYRSPFFFFYEKFQGFKSHGILEVFPYNAVFFLILSSFSN
jgi:hypothetical protein